MERKMSRRTMNLVLGGVLVSLGTILSFVKVFELPQGGAITLCSMVPVALFAYRCGTKWGLFAGAVFAALQLLFGMGALKGVTGISLVGSIVLDYLLAYLVLGLGGIFRDKVKSDALGFSLGMLVCGVLRYLCSFLSGWLLWGAYADATAFPGLAGMDGTTLAFFYSLFYNGSYMVPEIILSCAAAFAIMQLGSKRLLSPSMGA